MQFRDAGEDAALDGVAIEEAEAIETGFIQVVMDVGGEVWADGIFAEAEFRRPNSGDLGEAGWDQAMVAGLLKDGGEIEAGLLWRHFA